MLHEPMPATQLVELVGPPPLLLAANAMPRAAKPTPDMIRMALWSPNCALCTPAGLPTGSVVVPAKALVTTKLPATTAAPKVRIRFSITI